MIDHVHAQAQASRCITEARERHARYTAAFFERGPVKEKSVVLDSHSQRIFRMRKGILTASRLIHKRLEADRARRWVPIMVTLTYRPEVEWSPKHVSDYTNLVQMYAKRQGQKLPYAWVMELQKSGKPHYHCIFWVPRSWRLPRSDARGWWPNGMTNTVRAKNPYGYLSKYASKAQGVEGHAFPKGARIHGIGGLTDHEAAIVAWWKLPKDLRLGEEGSHKWRRCPGGGWKCIHGEAAGEIRQSEWGMVSIDSVNKRVRVVEKAGRVEKPDVNLLVETWREKVYEEGRRDSQRWADEREAYRATLKWYGADLGYQYPVCDPIPIRSEPLDRPCSFHDLPLPF